MTNLNTKKHRKLRHPTWLPLAAGVVSVLAISGGILLYKTFLGSQQTYTFEPASAESAQSKPQIIYSNGSKLLLADVEDGDRTELPLPLDSSYAVSNDGKRIAYVTSGSGDLAVMRTNGSDILYAAKDNTSVSKVIAWASDNKHVLYKWEHRKSRPSNLAPGAPWCAKGECIDATGYAVVGGQDGGQPQQFKPKNDYEKWLTGQGGGKYFDPLSKKLVALAGDELIDAQNTVSVSPNGTHRLIATHGKQPDAQTIDTCDYYELTQDGKKGRRVLSTDYGCSQVFWKDDNSFFFLKSAGPTQQKNETSAYENTYQPSAIAVYNMATSSQDELLRSNDTTKDYFTLLGANGTHLIIQRNYVAKPGSFPLSRLESIAVGTKQVKVIDPAIPAGQAWLISWASVN